jgi:hypothetical protein
MKKFLFWGWRSRSRLRCGARHGVHSDVESDDDIFGLDIYLVVFDDDAICSV